MLIKTFCNVLAMGFHQFESDRISRQKPFSMTILFSLWRNVHINKTNHSHGKESQSRRPFMILFCSLKASCWMIQVREKLVHASFVLKRDILCAYVYVCFREEERERTLPSVNVVSTSCLSNGSSFIYISPDNVCKHLNFINP